jgi:hypothetical protein
MLPLANPVLFSCIPEKFGGRLWRGITAGMAITPDTKDWTFVLERTCPECGFDVQTFPREQVASMIRENAETVGWR